MRPVLLTAAFLAVAGSLALLFFRSPDPDGALHATPEERGAPMQEALDPPAQSTLFAVDTEAVEPPREVVEAPAADELAAAPIPLARVHGMVVDSNQRPVADLELRLSCVDGVWRESVEVPVIEHPRWPRPGYLTRTDAKGAFAFEVPVPTADWVTLYADSEPMLGKIGADFGPAGGRDEPRLVEGDNDLGTFVAPLAGALTGRVFDAGGAPIEGARVRLEGSFPGGFSVNTETGTDGRYVLAHLPAGDALVWASAPGKLAATREAPQQVRVRETLPGPDFELATAPVISGVVVDGDGAAVEGVSIQGWPVSSGTGAGARTDADGRFEMHLPQDEPYSLVIEHDSRFRKWGGHFVKAATFEPGTTDVRIVLERVSRMVIAVVDAETGEGIEGYALFAGEVGGYQLRSMLQWMDFPGGRVELHAAPGPGQKLYVRAPGYVPFESDLAYDEEGERLQTIRLERGARLSGRVVFEGAGSSGVKVTVAPQRLPKEAGGEVDPDDWWGDSWKHDVPQAARHPRELSTDAEGRFAVDDLAGGTYSVRLQSGRAAPHELEHLAVAAQGELDLGDVALGAGATLRCTVLLAGGASPIGLTYLGGSLDSFGEEIARADGRFELTGLPAGEQTVTIRADGVRVLEDASRHYTLEAGETREVAIDLRGDLVSRVSVSVTAAGIALADVSVSLVEFDEAGELRQDARPRPLGRTNDTGVATGTAPAGRRVRAVASRGELVLGYTDVFEPQAGDHPPVELVARTGTLTLAFPNDLVIPEVGTLLLRIRPLDGSPVLSRPWMFWHGNTAKAQRPTTSGTWDSPRVEIGLVGAGRYELLLGVWSGGQGGEPLETLRDDLRVSIEVREGEECLVDVPLE